MAPGGREGRGGRRRLRRVGGGGDIGVGVGTGKEQDRRDQDQRRAAAARNLRIARLPLAVEKQAGAGAERADHEQYAGERDAIFARRQRRVVRPLLVALAFELRLGLLFGQIGRASCRERVVHYV